MRYPPEELRQPSAQILRFSAVIVLIVSLYRRLFAFNLLSPLRFLTLPPT